MSFGSPYLSLPDFTYHRPTEILEVIELLKKHGDEAKIMGGGVGLLAFMKERLMSPSHIIDIKGVEKLGQIKELDGGGLEIGACVTLSMVAENDTVRERYAALHKAVSGAADPMIRGRATLVGNLCEAIPWVDSPPALISLDATVEIVGPGGRRSVPAENFVKGPVDIDLREGEFVTGIRLPPREPSQRSTFQKFTAGAEFSIASVAASVDFGKKRRANLIYGGIASTPLRCTQAEKAILDGGVSEASIKRAAEVAGESLDCVSDVLASAEYRKHLVQVLTVKALRGIFE